MSAFGHMSVPNQRNQPRGRYFANVARNLNSMRITAGKGVKVSQTGTGVTISAKGDTVRPPVYNDAAIAVIVSGSSLAGYTVSLFANGLDQARTGTGTLFFPETAAYSGQDLQPGDVLVAHSALVKLVEGLVP